MADRPADPPIDFATDDNYAAGSETWSGTPTKVEPDPGDQATGFVPNTKPPAQWWNWLFASFGGWLLYLVQFVSDADEFVYPTPKNRLVVVPGYRLVPAGAGWAPNASGFSVTTTNNSIGVLDLSEELPDKCTLGSLFVRGVSANASAVGMTFTVKKYEHSTNNEIDIVTVNSSVAAGAFNLLVNCGGELIDKEEFSYRMNVTATSTAASGGNDVIRSFRINLDAVGPSQF
jgi:hypothetical protein